MICLGNDVPCAVKSFVLSTIRSSCPEQTLQHNSLHRSHEEESACKKECGSKKKEIECDEQLEDPPHSGDGDQPCGNKRDDGGDRCDCVSVYLALTLEAR